VLRQSLWQSARRATSHLLALPHATKLGAHSNTSAFEFVPLVCSQSTIVARVVVMQDLVDQLSEELSAKYLPYIETFMVDLWSENGFVEFRCGFALRSDHVRQSLIVKLPAASGTSDAERQLLTRAVFEDLEEQIDLAIANNKVASN
jgi:hypothetical protein